MTDAAKWVCDADICHPWPAFYIGPNGTWCVVRCELWCVCARARVYAKHIVKMPEVHKCQYLNHHFELYIKFYCTFWNSMRNDVAVDAHTDADWHRHSNGRTKRGITFSAIVRTPWPAFRANCVASNPWCAIQLNCKLTSCHAMPNHISRLIIYLRFAALILNLFASSSHPYFVGVWHVRSPHFVYVVYTTHTQSTRNACQFAYQKTIKWAKKTIIDMTVGLAVGSGISVFYGPNWRWLWMALNEQKPFHSNVVWIGRRGRSATHHFGVNNSTVAFICCQNNEHFPFYVNSLRMGETNAVRIGRARTQRTSRLCDISFWGFPSY